LQLSPEHIRNWARTEPRLADAGADVIATARRQQQVDDTAGEIEARGSRTLRIASDVCDRASLEALLTATINDFGKVDILVNCAGKSSARRR